jgi:hypothetical protein
MPGDDSISWKLQILIELAFTRSAKTAGESSCSRHLFEPRACELR